MFPSAALHRFAPRPAAEPPGLRRGGLARGGEDRAERRLALGGQCPVLLLGPGGGWMGMEGIY